LPLVRDVFLDPPDIPRDLTHDDVRNSRLLELDHEKIAIPSFAEQINDAYVGGILSASIASFIFMNGQPWLDEGQIGRKKIFELSFKR
jgi:hypothetical protein